MLNRVALKGRKIAVLIADGFEMVEYTVPVNALRLAGADITVLSIRQGRIRGVNLHEPAHRVHADMTISEANPDDFDGLFFPGGLISPDLLRQSSAVRDFVRAFDEAKKPVATLCHGPWLLSSAGILKGRTVTSWPGIRDDLVNAGATWLDQPVVRDGNWVTSRGPQDLADFVPAMTDLFTGALSLQASVTANMNAESAPQASEPPMAMVRTMQWLPRPSVRGFALGAIVGGLATAFALQQRSSA